MLESCRNAQERWGGVCQLVNRWPHERQQLVQVFDALSGIQAPASNAEGLQHFCQLSLDCISAGYLEVYEQLMAEGKAFGGQCDPGLAKQIFPRLEAVTEPMLNFNDRCDNGGCRGGVYFIVELKASRQRLYECFGPEDCLIEVLYSAHSQSGAESSAVLV